MRADNWRHGIRERHPVQNLGAYQGMNFHLLEFFRRQLSRLVDDLLRHRQFSDVMQQCCCAQRLNLILRQTQLLRHFDSIGSYALQMGVCRMILGFDGECERLDGAHVQRRNLLHMPLFHFDPLLFRLQPAEIQPV